MYHGTQQYGVLYHVSADNLVDQAALRLSGIPLLFCLAAAAARLFNTASYMQYIGPRGDFRGAGAKKWGGAPENSSSTSALALEWPARHR